MTAQLNTGYMVLFDRCVRCTAMAKLAHTAAATVIAVSLSTLSSRSVDDLWNSASFRRNSDTALHVPTNPLVWCTAY
jgi:hypothetical protein